MKLNIKYIRPIIDEGNEYYEIEFHPKKITKEQYRHMIEKTKTHQIDTKVLD